MAVEATDETSIGVTAFKSQCLGLIDDVVTGKTKRIVLLKHNRPVAAIVPITQEGEELTSLDGIWGVMRELATIPPGVDITEPTGEVWNAEQ
jgi:antitoxin (DNA-binding transcriptional repressor) of toxin-antitoxin stability system